MSRYFRPDRIEDVSAALATGGCLLLAGATDHFPTRGDTPHAIIDLSRLPGLRAIERRGDHWWLPCLATWSDVIAADLPPQFAGLQAAARRLGEKPARRITDTAFACGFNSSQYFAKLFRQQFGCAPRDYRPATKKT